MYICTHLFLFCLNNCFKCSRNLCKKIVWFKFAFFCCEKNVFYSKTLRCSYFNLEWVNTIKWKRGTINSNKNRTLLNLTKTSSSDPKQATSYSFPHDIKENFLSFHVMRATIRYLQKRCESQTERSRDFRPYWTILRTHTLWFYVCVIILFPFRFVSSVNRKASYIFVYFYDAFIV